MTVNSTPFYYQQPFCEKADGCRVFEFAPPKDLAPYVASMGFVHIRRSYVRQRVPDACFSVFIGVHERSRQSCCRVLPPTLSWGHWPIPEGWSFVEARLRWGAGMHLLNCSPEDLGPKSRDASDVLGSRWASITDQVAETDLPRERMLLLIEALRGLRARAGDIRPELMRTMSLLEDHHPEMRVDHLAEVACLSSSQLRRLFAKEMGSSPKDLLRLSRLWWSMRVALSNPDLSWGSIAADAGFSDQAHLVDEYRHFTGATPRQWYSNLFGVGSAASPRQAAMPA